jgi:hypothetical protein
MIHPENELMEAAKVCKSMAKGFKKNPFWGVDLTVEIKQEGTTIGFEAGNITLNAERREFSRDKIDGGLSLGVDRRSIRYNISESWRLGLV